MISRGVGGAAASLKVIVFRISSFWGFGQFTSLTFELRMEAPTIRFWAVLNI